VEAYVSTTLCGVASIRGSEIYVIGVAGPDSIPGCTAGGPVRFVVDGDEAWESGTNAPEESTHLDLTVPAP
jgi:hypothetical protein